MMLRLLSALMIIMCLSNMIPLAAYADEPVLSAGAWILMDMETGQVLSEKNADTRWSPASTTKMMTALVALENADPDTVMTASQTAIDSVGGDYVRAGVLAGEELTLQSLLDFMLVTSANEAAYIIGENVASSRTIAGFEAMMNARAVELGLDGTHFTNPCGIDDPQHYSTARDLAKIGQAVMQFETFRDTVIKTEIQLPDTNKRKSAEWSTHLLYTNKLLASRSKLYTTVTGIKTGFTDTAGKCLVFSAKDADGMELLGVLLGEPDYDTLFAEAQLLLEYGFGTFSMQTLSESGAYYGKFDVVDAVDNAKVTLNTRGDVTYLMPRDEAVASEITTLIPHLPASFEAPIEKGQKLGTYDILVSGKRIGSVDLVAENSIEKTTIAQVRDKYDEIIADPRTVLYGKIAAAVLVLFLLLRTVLKIVSRRRNRHRYTSIRKNHYRIHEVRNNRWR